MVRNKNKKVYGALLLAPLFLWTSSLVWAQDRKALEKIIEGAKSEGRVKAGGTVRWLEGGKPGAKKMVEVFQARYPFVKVEYERVGGFREREKVLSEMAGGNISYDTATLSETQVRTALEAKVVEMVDWRSLGVHPQHVHPDGFGVNYRSQVYGIAYNRKLVPDKVGTKLTWDDCASPKWKGKVAMDVRPRHMEVLWQPHVWGREKTLAHARQVSANQAIFERSRDQAMQKLNLGEYPVLCGPLFFTYYDQLRSGRSKDIGFVLVEPIPVTLGDVVFIARGSKHKNAAKLWIVWSLSDEGQAVLDEVEGSGSPVFPGTQAAKMIKGKKVAFYETKWRAKSDEILKEIIEAVGLPVVQ
ncbi:MAG: extracellular solute-binding protein [Deltaproteobacteria bacterium]|nr:extracellular solute-binding protein [Deltaproteobacteria bacterium]